VTLSGAQFIGPRVSREAPAEFSAFEPASGKELGPRFAEASASEVQAALALADAAGPALYAASGTRRAELLEAIADEITALGDALIERAGLETGLPAARLVGERGRTVSQLRLLASYAREGSWVNARIDRADPARQPLPKPDVRSMLRGLGPVVVFAASNFPLAFSVAGGDTASALAAGNPVVVKAHPAHPGTSELVAGAIVRAVRRTDFPDGTFSMVQGAGYEVGISLVQDPRTKAVAFTGSLAGGRALFDAAARRPDPIPVFAEMGSQNPLIVLPGALQARAAELAAGLHQSLTLGVGQFCTNPGLILVLACAETSALLGDLAQRIEGTAAGTMLAPRIADGYRGSVAKATSVTGVRVLAQGASGAGCGATATLLHASAQSFLASPELAHEVFGPCGLVVECADVAELEQVLLGLGGQLTATVHATDAELTRHVRVFELLERCAGRVIVGGFPTGVEVCHAMQHGGPYPATTDARFTSVGSNALLRFARPVCYQSVPDTLLPAELKNANPAKILRLVDGNYSREPV
jgi:2,5-dioxopentanoate dehydrogenase